VLFRCVDCWVWLFICFFDKKVGVVCGQKCYIFLVFKRIVYAGRLGLMYRRWPAWGWCVGLGLKKAERSETPVDVVFMIRDTFMEFFAATALMLTINLVITFQSSVEILRLAAVRYSVLASSVLLIVSLIVGGFTAGYLLDVAQRGEHRGTAILCARVQWWTFVFGVIPLLIAIVWRIGFG